MTIILSVHPSVFLSVTLVLCVIMAVFNGVYRLHTLALTKPLNIML